MILVRRNFQRLRHPILSILLGLGVAGGRDTALAFQPSSPGVQLKAHTGDALRRFPPSSFLLASSPPTTTRPGPTSLAWNARREATTAALARRTGAGDVDDGASAHRFDPLGMCDLRSWDDVRDVPAMTKSRTHPSSSSNARALIDSPTTMTTTTAAALAASTTFLVALPDDAHAALSPISTGDFNPDNFRPVCAVSDGFYRFLQGTTQAIVGEENFVEYGPLIAGGLLRVRLELCVVESFFNEAVGPFVKQNGLRWILPLHESVETFLAGTIFAIATTFILVGSTKLISVIVTYGDVFVGGPCRLFGGFFFDRARGKPVTLDVGVGPWKKRIVGPPDDVVGSTGREGDGKGNEWDLDGISPANLPVVVLSGAVKSAGEASKLLREFIDGLDLFVGRYLVLIATGYIGLKFLHFKIFPDFPPF